MACRYTYKGKTYEVSEFDDLLRAMPPAEAAKFMPGVEALPAAPFIDSTDKWLALALKRVIKLAVDEGYDRVAFINGEQSAERYDLSKHIDGITLDSTPEDFRGKYRLKAWKGSRSVLDDYYNDEASVADVVGKEVARKLFEDKEVEGRRALEGLDLKVGGEGMRAFYDKIVPNVAKEVLRKLGGGQVGIVKVDGMVRSTNGNMEAGDFYDRQENPDFKMMEQPGFSITDRMREAAADGLPLFSRAYSTDTPAFRRWFGDSKVVDAQGRPLVVYHGTNGDFSTFDTARFGAKTDDGAFGRGFYFSPSHGNGTKWAGTAGAYAASNDGGNIMPVYLRMERPLIVASADYGRVKVDTDKYDGVIVEDAVRGQRGPAQEYVVFHPEQIKSSIGNRGTFDPSSPDIRYSVAPDETPAGRRTRAQDLVNTTEGVFGFARMGETKQDKLRSIIDGARKFWLGALTRDQIADTYGDEIPQVREYDRLTRAMENERSKRAQDADELYNEWAKIDAKANARLADIMADATVHQVHPDAEFELPEGVRRGSREDALYRAANAERWGVHRRLKAEYEALPTDAKATYQKVKRYHADTLTALRDAVQARIEREVEAGPARQGALDKLRKQFDQYLGKGPYFPLSRFGDYLVVADRESDGEHVVASYGSAGEQQEAARRLEADGFTVKTKVAEQYSRTSDGAAGKFIGNVLLTIDALDFESGDAALKARLLDDINQLFIRALPDISYRKHFQHRKGTPGFSSDMMRGFASSAFHAASHIARLNHGDLMTRELEQARQTMRDAPSGDFNRASQIINEMMQRNEAALNPNTHPVAALLNQIGFVMYLGASPAAGIVNMLQTVMVTMPHLGARYGFTQANVALAKAYKDVLAAPPNAKNGWNAAQSMKLSDAERAAMTQLQDEGKIDLTQAHALADATNMDTGSVAQSKASFAMARAMRLVGWTFHIPEVMNRQVSALAAYRMEMKRSGDAERALNVAREAIDRTHFNYLASNRARYMQGNIARVALQFKQYSQNMTYLLGRAMYQALKGETAEVKAIARRQLLATLGVTWALAGTLGLPAVGSVMGLIGVLVGALSDKDEPWDWETEFRNLMADTFGVEAGEVLSRGVPRALMPWDISSRVGMADLWWRQNNRAEPSPREAFASDIQNLLGPTAGTALGLYTAADHMARGNWTKATEALVPKFLRDPIKAVREGSEGVTDYRGQKLLDLTALEAFGRFIGFAPARASEMYAARSAVKNAEESINARREVLLSNLTRARMDGDADGARELLDEIAAFNERHPSFRITGESMIRSLMATRRARQETRAGVRLSRSHESLRELGRFAGEARRP